MIAFTTARRDGDAKAPGALALFLRSKKLPVTFAGAEQVHGAKIAIVPKHPRPRKFMKSDGLLTDSADQPLAIFTADCVPVFLSAGNGRVVGLLHAGWRGVQKRILQQAVRLFRRKWRIMPGEVQAWVGPHIGPCCFEVRWDVARHFPTTRLRRGFGGQARLRRGTGGQARWTVDLEGELKRQAKYLGVRWLVPHSLGGGRARKKTARGCTMHDSRYFSYRRNRTEKRQVSIIMK